MLTRCRSAALLLALLIGAAGTGVGQDKKDDPKKKPDAKAEEVKKADPKDKEKDDDAKKKDEDAAANKAAALEKYAKDAKGEEVSFTSADGVKLKGLFFKAQDGSRPVVLMLHDYKANSAATAWASAAKLCLAKGFNVLMFDFRGHGKSTEVIAGDFWVRKENRTLITGGSSATITTKTAIKVNDFRANYYPMLVQDIAAARNYLDQLNDTGVVNTSTVYLLGCGDAAGLGFLYMASEWSRERIKPNVGVPAQFVSIRRNLFPSSEPAGPDIAGAIWLGATLNKSIPLPSLKEWCLQPATIELRSQTRMLFISGEKDATSVRFSKQLYSDVLLLDKKVGPGGQNLTKPEFTSFVRDIKGSDAAGVKLLGNKLDTETLIGTFLRDIDKDRGAKTSKKRDWDKPLWINVVDYGVAYQ